MKKINLLIFIFIIINTLSCSAQRYNTQTGALFGAGIGAITGQAVGRDTRSTLIGAELGTILGSIIGNAADQNAAAARERTSGNRVPVYDHNYRGNFETVPTAPQNPCRKVTRRIWENGRLTKEIVEEICESD